MVNYTRWSAILTLLVSVLGIIYALPNFLPASITKADLPALVPHQTMNLGLDLQGGSSLLLEVDVESVIGELLESTVSAMRRELRGERIGYTDLGKRGPRSVGVRIREPARVDDARRLLAGIDSSLDATVEGNEILLSLSDKGLEDRRDAIIQQSIEIVRRRVDETGVAEPVIQRQGAQRILVQLPGLDDPERIKRLLGRTAKLNFHLVDETATTADALSGNAPAGSMVLPLRGSAGSGPAGTIVVRREIEVGGDRLVDASTAFQDGQPVVSFRFDAAGGSRFGEITSQNVGKRLAIVLDNEVISAPVIRSPILGGSGIITGGFTVAEANDLALLLRAGALPAPLVILEERTVGPGLGADSIAAGEIAGMVGFALVIVFMLIAFGLFGLFADIALILNMALIVAALSLLQATLTLPGIAGIVLTIGMAVDANVLIFERIREEVRAGRSPIAAIDAGYRRALTTIIDSNITTLIAAILLYQFGSGPIRGFAVTLSIGIITSMFTAVMVTRLMVVTWLRRVKPQAIPI